MALLTRVSRLFRADMHAVLDRIEEPATLLRQAIREMEEALAAERGEAARLEREQERLSARLEELERGQRRIAGELDVCFEASNHELARTLIRRRLEGVRLSEALQRRGRTLARDLEERDRRIAENTEQLESMRQKAEILAEESPTAEPEEDYRSDITVTAADVEIAFLREQRERGGS